MIRARLSVAPAGQSRPWARPTAPGRTGSVGVPLKFCWHSSPHPSAGTVLRDPDQDVSSWRGRARTSNLLIQSQAFCRLNYPPRGPPQYPTPPRPLRQHSRGPSRAGRTGAAWRRWSSASYPASRHGIADQEAPQAHAEEEAQEDAEGHSLAATSRRQVTWRGVCRGADTRRRRTTTHRRPHSTPVHRSA